MLLSCYVCIWFNLTGKILLNYLSTQKMAETFFPQVLPDLAMKMVIMWKPQRVYSITKNSYETLGLRFTFWDTLCDLHKQAHAQTHINYFVYPINIFYFHNLPGVIALVPHSLKDVFDTSHLCVCIPKENNLLSRTPPDTGLYLFLWLNNK